MGVRSNMTITIKEGGRREREHLCLTTRNPKASPVPVITRCG